MKRIQQKSELNDILIRFIDFKIFFINLFRIEIQNSRAYFKKRYLLNIKSFLK